jgi:hypothetical protein
MENPSQPPPRITMRHLGAELVRYLNFEKGILRAAKELCLRPGTFLQKYLYETRKGYTSPIGFLLVSVTLATILTANLPFELMPGGAYVAAAEEGQTGESGPILMEYMMNYYNLILLFVVPILALCTFLFFRKSGYNFAENLAINAYVNGFQNLIYVILGPLFFLGGWAFYLYLLLSTVYQLVAFKHIFQISWGKAIWRGSLALFLGYLLYMVVLGILLAAAALIISPPGN